ncbi:hypothetical protein [Ferruginibacter sp.]|nr:hypothetical protein [Ferruginibacter sp.]
MSGDLISNNFAENINKNSIQRNIRLLWIILILFSLYVLFEIIEWALFLTGIKDVQETTLTFYSYKIMPIVSLINLAIGVLIWLFYIKGHKLILLSFEKDNADIFNKGYSMLNKATSLNIIGYSLILLSLVFRFILKYSSGNL